MTAVGPIGAAARGRAQFLSPEDAVALIPSGVTVAIAGSGGGLMEPDALIKALAARFEREGLPRDLTILHSMGLGDKVSRGMSFLAKPGLVKRVIGGHMGNSTHMCAMIAANEVEAYNLPLGVLSQLFRDTAAGRPGLLTKIGIGTFVDPRQTGGALNDISKEKFVDVITIDGEEYLFYKAIPIDFAFVRATAADAGSNISFEDEHSYLDVLETCMAARTGRNGVRGTCFVQVKHVRKERAHPKNARIPAMLVSAIVPHEGQWQSYIEERNDAVAGDVRLADDAFTRMAFSWRKVIARRGADLVRPGDVINLGVGVPDGVASVLNERGMMDRITMTNEHGVIGGVTSLGMTFGASRNHDSIVGMPAIIDLYQGGLLDIALLGFAQIDRHGNVNVSKYNGQIMGSGGFIDITQNARRIGFCGSFLASGFELDFSDGGARVVEEGRHGKFVSEVEHITFNGTVARERGQEVWYLTERATFRLAKKGVELVEVAKGIDVENDIQAHCRFPLIIHDVRPMDASLFHEDAT
jgi:acyl CoA:acetate/3-ketoacid CoA transferase